MLEHGQLGERVVSAIGCAGAGLCAFCAAPAEGNHKIHRDGFGVGPQVDLCDAHGSGRLPSCEQIWNRIAQPSDDASGFAHRPQVRP